MSNTLGSVSQKRSPLQSSKTQHRRPVALDDEISRARRSAKGHTLSSDPHYTETDARKARPSPKAFIPDSALRPRALLAVRDALNEAIQTAKPFMYSPGRDGRQLVASCTALCARLEAAMQNGLGDSHADLIPRLRRAPQALKAAFSSGGVSAYLNAMLELSNAMPSELLEVKQVAFSPTVEVVASPSAASLSAARLMKAVVLAQQDARRFQSASLNGDEAWSAEPRQKLPTTLQESSRTLVSRLMAAEKAFSSSHPVLVERLKLARRKDNASSPRMLGSSGKLDDYAASLDALAADIEKALHQTAGLNG